MDIVKFIDEIIYYSILNQKLTIIIDEALSTFFNETDNEFLLKLEKNSNAIAVKTQLYFSFYNITCFKYRATFLRHC